MKVISIYSYVYKSEQENTFLFRVIRNLNCSFEHVNYFLKIKHNGFSKVLL